jgi:tRNA A-37 threonylcarbamoyl transferase component Bud32/tetratricopeptide (TPR) repeat protein
MHKHFTCAQGHHWQVDLGGDVAAAVDCIACPQCGSVAQTLMSEAGGTHDEAGGTHDEAAPTLDLHGPDQTAAIARTNQSAGYPEVPGYQILGELGRGGMGVVYKARHRVLNRLVAIKMPLSEYVVSADARERFLREARSAAQLRHPNICPIYEVGQLGARPFIVLGFIEGSTLREWAERQSPTAARSAEMVALLARSVGFAHQHGVVHRDLKPANVLVDEATGMPVLMDFGLAKLSGEGADLTLDGQVMGTPAYMAPEQAAGQVERVGPPADIYSLGTILYELLCGRPPLVGSAWEIVRRVQTDDVPPPRKLVPRIHRDLDTICLKALAKDPACRYPSAMALAEDLERFCGGEAILARREGLARKLMRKARRHRVGVAAFSLVLLGALAAVSSVALSSSSARRLANLAQTFEADLNSAAWDEPYLKHMESLLSEMTELEESPDEVQLRRQKLHQRFAEYIHDKLIRREQLTPEDVALVQSKLKLLARRDSDLMLGLQKALQARVHDWKTLVDLQLPLANVEAVFSPAHIQSTTAGLRPRPGRGFGETVPTRVGCQGDVRIEATFDADWAAAAQVGLEINSSPGATTATTVWGVSPDGALLATSSTGQAVLVWEVATGRVLSGLDCGLVGSVAFRPASELLVAERIGVRRWNWQTGEVQAVAPASYSGSVVSAQLSPRGERAAFAFADGVIKVWDVTMGQPLATLSGHGPGPPRMAFSGDGALLASADYQGTAVKLWDVATGHLLSTVKIADKPVVTLAFSPDGKFLAVHGYNSATAWLWDLQREAFLPECRHPKPVVGLAFLPDRLATIAADGQLRFWDPREGRQQASHAVPGVQPWSLAFSPRGNHLFLGTREGAIKHYSATGATELGTWQRRRYAFVVRVPPRDGAANSAAPAESRTLAQARSSGERIEVEICRDDQCLRAVSIEASALPQGPLRLAAAREGNRLLFQVHDLPPLRFDDVFPLSTVEPGVFGLQWPDGGRLTGLRILRRTQPAAPSRLEQGNELYARGAYLDALTQYQQQAAISADNEAGLEARYKQAQCLVHLNRLGEAEGLFQQLMGVESRTRWPLLSAVQLWLRRVEQQRLDDAQAIFEHLVAGHRGEDLAETIPQDLRDQVAAAHIVVANYFEPDPQLVDRAQYGVEVADFLQAPPNRRASLRWLLFRALHLHNRLSEATQLAEKVLGSPDLARWAPNTLVAEHCWLLRLLGQPQQALAEMDRWLSGPGQFQDERAIVLLERARILAALGKWKEAESEVDALLRDMSEDELRRHHATACLLHGYLRQQQGNQQGAIEAWEQGSRRLDVNLVGGHESLHSMVLASLVGGESLDLVALNQRFTAPGAGESAATLVFRHGGITFSTVRAALQTDRGREYARQVALRELTLPEEIRTLAQLILVELVRTRAFAGQMSPEQEQLIWQSAEDLLGAYLELEINKAQVLQVLLAWKGNSGFLGWGSVGPALEPGLRGPLAYLLGHKSLRGNDAQAAAMYFRVARSDAAADSSLQRLAQAELDRLMPD